MDDLTTRLAPFIDAGLLERAPTAWQIFQGELEMWPFVISTEVTAEEHYQGAPFGHPLLRQPLIFRQVGLDHLRIGTGMRSQLRSVIRHLLLTYHRGMPAWDLQLIQTHPGGLDAMRAATESMLAGDTPESRQLGRVASRILPDPDSYHRQFLGPDGWIARADRMEFPAPSACDNTLPPEFFSLTNFMAWSAESFPARAADAPTASLPGHLLRLATRRFREGGRFGWFDGAARPETLA